MPELMTKKATEQVRITVPLVPPSVNHYKMRTRKGVTFVSAEAKAFKAAVAVCLPVELRGLCVLNYDGLTYHGLCEAGVIHSDAAITDLLLRKRRDRENPRTEIVVTAL